MSSQPLRVIFAGTPEFAALHLAALLNSEHEIVAVYTQPDRRAGRGKTLTASPVKQLAIEHELPIYQPLNFKAEEHRDELKALNADVMIVVAYGLILPQAVLDTPRYGCINVHASLLPRWRGAAPIQRAIEAGDTETGITIMRMEAGLDTGPMLAISALPITDTDTGGSLHDKLASTGPGALLNCLADLENILANAQQQDDSQANYAHKLTKDEALINWQTSAEELARKVRAFNPFPVCYTTLGQQRLKIYRASAQKTDLPQTPGMIISADDNGILVAAGEGALLLQTLQLPGGKALEASALLNARRAMFAPGTPLGEQQAHS